MEFFKKHVDSIAVMGTVICAALWMTGQIHQVQREMDSRFARLDKEMSNLDKEISIVKTVLLMKNIMPPDLAVKNEQE
jgi:hypothetical protein